MGSSKSELDKKERELKSKGEAIKSLTSEMEEKHKEFEEILKSQVKEKDEVVKTLESEWKSKEQNFKFYIESLESRLNDCMTTKIQDAEYKYYGQWEAGKDMVMLLHFIIMVIN